MHSVKTAGHCIGSVAALECLSEPGSPNHRQEESAGLGDFEVRGKLGEGGCGKVVLVKQRPLGRRPCPDLGRSDERHDDTVVCWEPGSGPAGAVSDLEDANFEIGPNIGSQARISIPHAWPPRKARRTAREEQYRAGKSVRYGAALPVIMSIIRSSEKPTTTATITSQCAV